MVSSRPYRSAAVVAGLALAVCLAGSYDAKQRGSHHLAKTPGNSKEESIERNNLGVAYLNRQQDEKALAEFDRAYALDPNLYAARLNQGIALLNLQRFVQARSILVEAGRKKPGNPRVWYNLGLLDKAENHPDRAAADFERVAALDPKDADTEYLLGQSYIRLRDYAKAIAAFGRALKINPLHVSAEFALAQAYERSGDSSRAREHLVRFQHLTQDKLGRPMSLIYGEQGRYSLAKPLAPGIESVPAPIPVHFVDVTRESGLPTRAQTISQEALRTNSAWAIGLGAGACAFDYDGDGRPDIFLVNADGSGSPALYHNLGKGHFEDVTRKSGIKIPGLGMGCAAGDYDNDGHPDLAVSYNGGVALFHNEGNGTFRDVTAAAGIHVSGMALGLTFVDYDHDGDLDLFVSRLSGTSRLDSAVPPKGPANMLWRNNGNGTFTDVTQEAGLAGPGRSWGAVASDINNDRAVDLVVSNMDAPPVVYLNPREGAFHATAPWVSPMPAPAVGILAFDFNKDGWMDLAFTHSGSPGLSVWRNVKGKSFAAVPLPKVGWQQGWGLAALDYDNDGWIDLAAVGEDSAGGHVALLRNEGPAGFRDVSHAVGLDRIRLNRPRSVVAFDFDGDGSTDLLITQNQGPPVLLRNVGGSRNHWLQLALKGGSDNRSAIGTKVEVYAGTLRQKWEISGASGYLGQSETTITAGLDIARRADIVRMLWPTGVLQDEVGIPADSLQSIAEIDRRGSSCPLLFAWNGETYQFIADILGPGIVGHWIAPGKRNIPDPNEYLKVDGASVRPKNGRLSFRLLEPMEELDYLDQVRLLAVDHPADVDVYPNERFASNPPFPAFKVIASRNAKLPVGAWNDRGQNVLPALLHRDHRFVVGFGSLPFQGFAPMHWLELDIGSWNPARPLRLLLDGFTDYFTADSMYAAWQAGVKPAAPYVEALGKDGRWRIVSDDMGFPAGLERTMIADLTGKLPPGTRRIRIVTNLKIYWDRIRIDNSAPDLPFHVTALPLAAARLEFRGYPRAVEGQTPGDLHYVYDEVSATGPYAMQAGNYTRYGDVRALVKRADEEFVIFGSGEEVAADFDPSSLPRLPRGWVRDYFFDANGFDKDMDFYADYGDTVDPLPFHTLVPYPYSPGVGYPMDRRHVQYILQYDTRAISGRLSSAYRFQYHHTTPP